VPGEDLPGSWSATQFVAWYNGHPDFQGLDFDLSVEQAVVVGAGNVALDVARMLALTREELAPTDATDSSIEAIAGSGIREIVVLARRGPAQAAFTTPELKEMGELAGADILVDARELELDPASEASIVGNTNATRNMEVLREFASREPSGKPRRVVLRFLVSPVAILGEEHVEGVEIVQNELVAADGRISARPTERRETIDAGIVFRSVGYRGVPVPGLPFDPARGTLPNDGGRVLDEGGAPLAGVYCAGWIKRGPTGVIGTNKKDATETVQLLLEDVAAGRLPRAVRPRDLAELLAERGADAVLYAGWEEIDRVEKAAGEPEGRPRVKLCSWDDLLAAGRLPRSRDAA
jgi:ferredoxin/flavodoxin---NADP+ reductase